MKQEIIQNSILSKMTILIFKIRIINFIGIATILLGIMSTSSLCYADTKNESPASDDLKFTCVKSRNIKLAELKEKLTTTCNLNKPFSIASTDIGVDTSYTYCCHSK